MAIPVPQSFDPSADRPPRVIAAATARGRATQLRRRTHVFSLSLAARLAIVAAVATVALSSPAGAQAPQGRRATPLHPKVCAAGVRIYNGVSEVPKPYDSLTMPPGPRIQVTNPAEAEAAERAVRERAGSVGATGIVFIDETENGPEGMTMRRAMFPVFVASDSARAQRACR